MKKLNILVGLAAAALAFTSCSEPVSPAIKNAVYIADAATTNTKKIATDATGGRAVLTARMADFMGAEVNFDWEIDAKVLADYNAKNETAFEQLPEAYYDVDKEFGTIKVGATSSEPMTIDIKSMDALPTSTKYAIPVKITNVEGCGVLESSSTIVIVLDRVIVTKAWNMNGNYFSLAFPENLQLTLPVFSVEFLIKPLSLNPSNMALYMMYGPSGPMDGYEMFTRFGDVAIENEQLQVKTQGQQPATNYRFVLNKWQHVAYVYDGTTFKIIVNGKTDVNFAVPSPGFVYLAHRMQFGGSNLKAQAAEIRLWNIIRTEAQLQDAQYAVDPATPGLVAYWKCDDNSTNTMKDYTGHGYDAATTSTNPYEWVETRFPEL